MNTPRWVVISSAVVLLCAAGSVSAALISWDWKTPGDNLLTYDSATGLDWLDWTESTNRSYNDVLTQLGPGGEFEGFRHASTDEVHTLFEHAGIPDIPGYTAANYTPVTELQALLGITRTYSGMGEVTYSVGMTSTPRFSRQITSYLRAHHDTMEGFAYPIGTGLGRGSVYSGVGHALVRSSPIPEPVAMVIWLLLGLGVLTLLGWSKKETETTAS